MILKEMLRFYYRMALNELRAMNAGDSFQGLSYNSMLYLNVISMMDECTASRLAKALHVSKPGVTAKINELVKIGAVVKRQSDDDKRVFYLHLSPRMEKSLHIYDAVFAGIEEELRLHYSSDQLGLFCEILSAISAYDWRNAGNE